MPDENSGSGREEVLRLIGEINDGWRALWRTVI